MFRKAALVASVLLAISSSAGESHYWIKAKAKNSKERSKIANIGVSIEKVGSDYIYGFATESEKNQLSKMGRLIEQRPLYGIHTMDFPSEDSKFRNYFEMTQYLEGLVIRFPDLVTFDSIGKTLEGRDIWHIRIGKDHATLDSKPGIAFMGGHHAREHISIETPLNLAEKLLTEYEAGNAEVKRLVDNRDIHIIPMVNPDGAEFDIADGDYQMWRKNRSPAGGGEYGTDLNRNYGFGWGGGGASKNPSSETYRGTSAFSELETQAIKKFVDSQVNITTLLSFHTFSELILYPWGHKDGRIEDNRDYMVHKTMAEKMATWNGYTPEQSSELYIASGDTTDWSYGVHKIISFTFELDPSSMFEGGFYPGQDKIDIVFNKNWQPCLYLIEYADNPYRVLEATHVKYGLSTPLID